jgi:mono/diheme cytochrome c family protein
MLTYRKLMTLVLLMTVTLVVAACGGDEATPEPAAEETELAPEETQEAAVPSGDNAELIAAAIEAGDVDNGRTVFNESYATSLGSWQCASCHSVNAARARLVGPGMYDLYVIAEDRLAESGDPDVVTYIRNSITMPAAHIVQEDPAYPENLMPGNYADVLTEQELTDVVAYILALGNPDA